MCYITFQITKDEMYIIISAFGDSGSYGTKFSEICLGHNLCTGPRRITMPNFTPIQGPVLINENNPIISETVYIYSYIFYSTVLIMKLSCKYLTHMFQ